MLNHGVRRLHTFVFQKFLNLIRYKQLRIDLDSNRSTCSSVTWFLLLRTR